LSGQRRRLGRGQRLERRRRRKKRREGDGQADSTLSAETYVGLHTNSDLDLS